MATKLASGEREAPVVVEADDVRGWLGRPHFFFEAADRTSVPGVVTGLAVTGAGGDVLFVEASVSDGPEGLTLTGQLGDVMKESAEIALSYVRSHAEELGIDPTVFSGKRFHVHVPAGAVPKDGPSAGVTMTTALVSLLRGVPVRSVVGMTGEVTLQGRVLPIGGVKQKVLAAHRAGLTEVVLPERNGNDLEDVPEEVRDVMTFHLAATIADVLTPALSGEGTAASDAGRGERTGRRGLRTGRLVPGRTARDQSDRDSAQSSEAERTVDDKDIVNQIGELAAEEQRLEEAHVGEGLSDDELKRKRDLEVTLDQLWDVLRQRRAKRAAGQDPDAACAALGGHRRGLSAVAYTSRRGYRPDRTDRIGGPDRDSGRAELLRNYQAGLLIVPGGDRRSPPAISRQPSAVSRQPSAATPRHPVCAADPPPHQGGEGQDHEHRQRQDEQRVVGPVAGVAEGHRVHPRTDDDADQGRRHHAPSGPGGR